MPNKIKKSGEGPALQVTKPARSAGLAEQKEDDDLRGPERWSALADVRVYGFDGLVLVFGVDSEVVAVEDEVIAEVAASAARDTSSIYEAHPARIRPAGNGTMVSLPGLAPTGLSVGDPAPVTPAPGMLIITDPSSEVEHLPADLTLIRQSVGGEDGDAG